MNRSMNQRRRAGMTILEVLFAIMITTVGLLGAIAVFPVASEYARKGRLNDELAVCAESAAHTMDTRGMRRPDHWATWRYVNGGLQGNAYYVPGTQGTQIISGPGVTPVIYVRAGVNPGESYCLDPRFVSANVMTNGSPPPALIPTYPLATLFPAFPRRGNTNAGVVSGPNDPDFTGGPGGPRMQRITLVNGVVGGAPYLPSPFTPMGRFQADNVFSFGDHLTYDRPKDNAIPAQQLYSGTTSNPGKREEDGKLSWIATLVPKIDRWNATLDDQYVLSVVVFYGRSPDMAIPDFSVSPPSPAKPLNEFTAMILGVSTTDQPSSVPTPPVSDFHSLGYAGGEVTITASGFGASDKLKVRAGDWIMLSGHARYAAGPTLPTFKWYRISDADEDPYEFPLGSGVWKRDVTLVGPDWDLQDVLPFDNTGSPNPNSQWDDVEVTIVPHVVAVFDRTVRLEQDGTGY